MAFYKLIGIELLLCVFGASSLSASNCSLLFEPKSVSSAERQDAALNSQSILHSLSEAFRFLVQKELLIGQWDSRLSQKDLIVPGGGLCATACGVNVLSAIAAYVVTAEERSHIDPVHLLDQMLAASRSSYQEDARKGLALEKLGPLLEQVGRQWQLPVKARYFEINLKEQLAPAFLQPRADELVIAGLDVGVDPQTGERAAHAIVILSFEESNQTVQYFNPNVPHIIFTTKLKPSKRQGSSTLTLSTFSSSDPAEGQILRYLKVKIGN